MTMNGIEGHEVIKMADSVHPAGAPISDFEKLDERSFLVCS